MPDKNLDDIYDQLTDVQKKLDELSQNLDGLNGFFYMEINLAMKCRKLFIN